MNKKAPTYRGTELMREVQIAALEEWNSDPKRPTWDREGRAVARIAVLPVGVLYYLEETAPPRRATKTRKLLEAFNAWREAQPRKDIQGGGDVQAEIADRLLRAAPFQVEQARAWLDSMRPALEQIDGRPVLDDKRIRTVVTHMETILGVLAALPTGAEDRGVQRDYIFAGLAAWLGRTPSNREAALASLLCGTGLTYPKKEQKVAEAIRKEHLAMQQAGLRAKRRARL